VFSDSEYLDAGARLTTDLSDANIIFGVKEVAPKLLLDGRVYCFFSHTAKGQRYNMPMLRSVLDRRVSLFDYELVRNDEGKRMVFFGEHAGYAGMIDSLWALGRRLSWEGIRSPFSAVRYATEYNSLAEIKEQFSALGMQISRSGIDRRLVPLVCGFTGYGRVSGGAQEIFDLLPTQELQPEDLPSFFKRGVFSDRKLYKVQFRKPDMFAPRKPGAGFDNTEFREAPDRYRSIFRTFLPFLTVLINGIYWEPAYPRLVTKKAIRKLYGSGRPRLRVIGDITCDVDGSIELTVRTTDAEHPVFTYEAMTGEVTDGWKGQGPVILAVDKLPTELPREASSSFGDALVPFVPQLAAADYSASGRKLDVPAEFRRALVAHRGRLAPSFEYLKQFLASTGTDDQ